MFRKSALRFSLLISLALVVSACDSYMACHQYYGDRLLMGEKAPASGAPTQLIAACMYGADTIGRQILNQNVSADQLCGERYSPSIGSQLSSDVVTQVTDLLQLNEACRVGVRGYVHEVLSANPDQGAFDPERCKALRGKYGINPQLPCD